VLVAAAICPHPPLLIPEATGGAGTAGQAAGPGSGAPGESAPADRTLHDLALGELRAACAAAVAELAGSDPDLLAVVGGGARTARYPSSAAGGLHELGIPVTVGSGPPQLPLSLTIGSWLLRRYAPALAGEQVQFCAVRRSLPAAPCLDLGAGLAALAPRVALLILGDGPARRAVGVPGAPDPAADAYDAEVAAALAAADPSRLARLDPALDDELLVAGRAAWQVLAGAAGQSPWRGRLRFAAAPLDVSYLVASWQADSG
jgi:hypothetical protein